ncbi:hypothetical protein M9H77_32067 [Catharanthus roseus]|uniref:Uncharacterized protein n=1 Tax=Catharanthus roseus TaxID=4058 RepID=A0ACC0A1T6_CATRO|nr:hypothetical protein M9H77_32067 [Catharanthus roseus]
MDMEMKAEQRDSAIKFCFSSKAILILFYCALQTIGQVGGPILTRIYFLHGGKRKWIPSWLLTAGFPCLIVPICFSLARRNRHQNSRFLVTRRLILASAIIGSLLGIDSYMYTIGGAYLPVSVSSLLSSSQLAFTSIFAFFLVKHKFTHYSINAVVLMTFGSIILGLHMNGDRPIGETNGLYMLGFFMTIAAAALHGFLMPAVEYTHFKAGVVVTYELVLQVQFLISAFATLFCTVPMIINKDFQAMPREAAEFGLGPLKYYMILFSAALALQCLVIGSLGIIFTSTSLLGGIVSSLLVPVQQAFAVFFLPESFNAEKGMALAMCLWGFASYFYGEYKTSQKQQETKQKSELGILV